MSTILMVAMLVAGVSIVAYPTFSDWWNSFHQTRAIASYVMAVEEADPKMMERMLAEAEAYNDRLARNSNRFLMSESEKAEYESELDLTGTGVMGYVQIPKIGVNYPIYHGMDESVLQVAIGHLEGTSLPVGGEETHAAISGHRGLPSAKLFTDLDQLVEGDTFTITVLNRTLMYSVDQIRIVDPSDLNDLMIEPESDYVTLITCTPYGVNSHRLLLRSHRIDGPNIARAIPAEAVQIPNYVAVPAVGIPLLFTYLVGSLIYYRVTDHTVDKEKVMAALDQMKDGEGHDDDGT